MASQRPSLLVYYHVPKTGGSSVREWILRNAGLRARGLPARLNGLVRYYEARCFVCLQLGERVMTQGCSKHETKQCNEQNFKSIKGSFHSRNGDWRTAGPLAIEFHGPSASTFLRDLLPHASALRAMYAQHNGTVVFATLVREPVDLLFSSYHMWPPRSSGGDGGGSKAGKGRGTRQNAVTPFPAWVRRGGGDVPSGSQLQQSVGSLEGLQVANFVDPACVYVSREHGQRNRCACDANTRRRAVAALGQFDVVGITSCLPGFMDELESKMRLSPEALDARALRRAMRGNVSAGPLRSKPRCTDCSEAESSAHAGWTWDVLDANTAARTLQTAACDAELYGAALEQWSRSRVPRGAGSTERYGAELDQRITHDRSRLKPLGAAAGECVLPPNRAASK